MYPSSTLPIQAGILPDSEETEELPPVPPLAQLCRQIMSSRTEWETALDLVRESEYATDALLALMDKVNESNYYESALTKRIGTLSAKFRLFRCRRFLQNLVGTIVKETRDPLFLKAISSTEFLSRRFRRKIGCF